MYFLYLTSMHNQYAIIIKLIAISEIDPRFRNLINIEWNNCQQKLKIKESLLSN